MREKAYGLAVSLCALSRPRRIRTHFLLGCLPTPACRWDRLAFMSDHYA